LNEEFSSCDVFYLVDGNLPMSAPYVNDAIIKGDAKIFSISAASVLAKVARDRIMDVYQERFPNYGFEKHKGYPTKAHKQKIKEIGPCEIHRRTFSGVKEHL
jgi:ribonuclease HII